MGFPFFKSLYLAQTDIRMHGCPFAQRYVETVLSKVMSPPNFPLRYADIKASIRYEPVCPERFEIDTVSIMPIPLSHPNKGRGYKIIEDGKRFVFLPDNELDFIHPGGLSFKAHQDFSVDAELLMHDAEYAKDEYNLTKKWGHSVYTTALELAISAKVIQFGVFHLNQDWTDQDVDEIVDTCQEIFTERGSDLRCLAVGADITITL